MIPTIILPTEYGNILCNRHDGYQSNSFFKFGKAPDHDEIGQIEKFIEPGMNAVDVGTCFGIWTLAFARRADRVYSFEAQRIVYQQLCGTLALNGIENVFATNVAIGAENGWLDVPKYNYNEPLESGCVYFCPKTTHGEMKQEVQPSTEKVPLATLDSFSLENIGLMKIDVEGMELDALLGAEKTIERNRPVLYVEIILLGRKPIQDFMEARGYFCTDNGANMMGIPKEKYEIGMVNDKLFQVTLKR